MGATIAIAVGKDFRFVARFEEKSAPKTVAAFRKLLPYKQKLVHCRWSTAGVAMSSRVLSTTTIKSRIR